MKWPVLIIISALIFSCTPKLETEHKAKAEPEKVISRDEAMGSLPCFKCHSFQKFAAAPKKGVFAHQLHTNTGFHCNQCHDFKGHQHVTIDRNICGNCHGIKVITFNKTSVPSKFNHEAHAKKAGCRDCHPGVFLMKAGTASITMKDIDKGAYCGACHNGKKAFASSECTKCHELKKFDKELTYKVDGVGNVVFSHKFHTGMFSCDECHPKHFAMKKTQGKMPMDRMNEGKFCGACHSENISDCAKCHKQ